MSVRPSVCRSAGPSVRLSRGTLNDEYGRFGRLKVGLGKGDRSLLRCRETVGSNLVVMGRELARSMALQMGEVAL